MKLRTKISLLAGIPAIAWGFYGALTIAHAANAQSINGHVSAAPAALTKSQIANVANSIYSITFPTGCWYVRTTNPPQFKPSQIAHSKAEAMHNPNIEEVILPYGTFVKAGQDNSSSVQYGTDPRGH